MGQAMCVSVMSRNYAVTSAPYMYSFVFFFSSRRRHTRCSRDWSSDVCSSDLIHPLAVPAKLVRGLLERFGTGNALRPKSKRAVGPNVYLAHLADCAGQNIFDGGTRVVHGMALVAHLCCDFACFRCARHLAGFESKQSRSEEHTSELQSRLHLVCRLLLEKKKKKTRM